MSKKKKNKNLQISVVSVYQLKFILFIKLSVLFMSVLNMICANGKEKDHELTRPKSNKRKGVAMMCKQSLPYKLVTCL